MSSLSEETLALMLEYNDQTVQLLDWAINMCYTAVSNVADKCFRALTTVFARSTDYPCDIVAMLAVALMYCGYPVAVMSRMSFELLQLLRQHFLDDHRMLSDHANTADIGFDEATGDANLTAIRSQHSISEHLAAEHPELTMPIFSGNFRLFFF